MPDPLLFLLSVAIALGASVMVTLALGWWGRSPQQLAICSMCVVGFASGVAAGCGWLRLPGSWPPVSALDRFLVLLLPAVIAVEWGGAILRLSAGWLWGARWLLAATAPRVLLHGSVYLDAWTAWQSVSVYAGFAVLLIGLWLLLARLAERTPGAAVPLALALTIQGAGAAIMLAGYLRGGGAALAVGAALLGASAACAFVAKGEAQQALVGLGVVSLCSLLVIGVQFGRLPSASGWLLLAAPLLGWGAEIGGKRRRSQGTVIALRLALTGVVVALVLLLAQRKFEREFRPLLFRANGNFATAY